VAFFIGLPQFRRIEMIFRFNTGEVGCRIGIGIPIGYYRWTYAGGNCPLRTRSPYYGRRQEENRTQIQIPYLGDMMWINVNPMDLV